MITQVQVYSSTNFLNVQEHELHTVFLLLSFYPCTYMAYTNDKQTNPKQLPSPPKISYCTKPQKTKLIGKKCLYSSGDLFQPRLTIYSASLMRKENTFLAPKLILNFQLGYSHSHWAYWLISHLFFFLPFQSPSEFRPVNIMTRNHTSAEHIPLPRAVAEPSPDTGGSRGASWARHRTLLDALSLLFSQPKLNQGSPCFYWLTPKGLS